MTSSYSFPGKILFGCGSSGELPILLPENLPVLVVLGKSAAENKDVMKTVSRIGHASVHVGVPAEPPLESVDLLIEEGRRNGVKCVAAIGGGSVIDAAKAAAALIPLEGKTADYFTGAKQIPGKGLFFAALPTTAGTGAESTNNSVLTDPATHVKKSLRHASMRADLAIVDPLLTLSCPAALTAASGLDAFVQAFEAYTSPRASELTRTMSARAAKLILSSLAAACRIPENLDARTAMAEGSMISGLGFSQCGLGGIHGLAHPIGSLLHVPHGRACAILMTSVMEFNMPACDRKYAELAQLCGVGKTAEDFVRAAAELRKRLGVPEDFSEYGLSERHFPFILANCRSASMKQNPRPMSDSEAGEILRKLVGKT